MQTPICRDRYKIAQKLGIATAPKRLITTSEVTYIEFPLA